MIKYLPIGLVALSFAAGAIGCKRTAPPSKAPPADQPTRGLVVYVNNCAGCHGENGEGDEENPPVIGAAALPLHAREGSGREATFTTAQDVFAYTKETMPQLAPGSLADDDYWDVVAYLLKTSSVPFEGDLGPSNAATTALRR